MGGVEGGGGWEMGNGAGGGVLLPSGSKRVLAKSFQCGSAMD